jgi:hypothetical protein
MLDEAAKKELRDLGQSIWAKGPSWRSRKLVLTKEARDYLARYLRWQRSLKSVETPGGSAIFRGRPDPEFPWSVKVFVDPPAREWGYLRPRGFSRRPGA